MRRSHCEITDLQEIKRILDATFIGRLATHGVDGYPYVTPVNFVHYKGKIYFHSAPIGQKLDNLAKDPRVCFEVDIPLAYIDADFDPDRSICRLHQFYQCVIIRGEARVIPDGPLKAAALDALVAKHEGNAACARVSEQMPAYLACKVIEIAPAHISAKGDLWQNKTPEERLAVARYLKERKKPGDLEAVKAMGFDPEGL